MLSLCRIIANWVLTFGVTSANYDLILVCSCFCVELVPKVCYNMVVPKLMGGILWHKDGRLRKII